MMTLCVATPLGHGHLSLHRRRGHLQQSTTTITTTVALPLVLTTLLTYPIARIPDRLSRCATCRRLRSGSADSEEVDEHRGHRDDRRHDPAHGDDPHLPIARNLDRLSGAMRGSPKGYTEGRVPVGFLVTG